MEKYWESNGYNPFYHQYRAMNIESGLMRELEAYFGSDKKRINHAKKVLGFAKELLRKEKGDRHIVIPAAILHDVGIKAAEEKYGSSAGHLQEKEGPEIARKILIKFPLSKKDIDEICAIIGCHHSPGKINSLNFKLLYDADWLVNLKDEVKTQDKKALKALIDKIFFTRAGKALAYKMYL